MKQKQRRCFTRVPRFVSMSGRPRAGGLTKFFELLSTHLFSVFARMEDERKKEGCTTQTFSTQLSSPKGRGQSTRTKMVLFLIPIAVVGYQIYDKKQKEKTARQQGGAREEETSHPASLHNDDDDASEQSEEGRNSAAEMKGSSSKNQKHPPPSVRQGCNLSGEDSAETSEDEEEDSRPEWIKGICKVFHNQNDPFAIRSNKEALTYEVMGNQGSNALPFPKIDYH